MLGEFMTGAPTSRPRAPAKAPTDDSGLPRHPGEASSAHYRSSLSLALAVDVQAADGSGWSR
jgi:hypothetical protein